MVLANTQVRSAICPQFSPNLSVRMAAAVPSTPTLLGYPDEAIYPSNARNLDFTTSKLGGKPNWPPNLSSRVDTKCSLCGQACVLLTQIYAPLEASAFHRTLYVLACLSPKCWNKSESWKCIRLQVMDPSYQTTPRVSTQSEKKRVQSSLFAECDEWEEGEEEENGNFLARGKPEPDLPVALESLNLSSDPRPPSSQSSSDVSESDPDLDDPNANARQGAAAVVHTDESRMGSVGTAEIEHDQDGMDVIAIDTPELADVNIPDLFQRASNDNVKVRNANVELVSYYLSVDEEKFGHGLDSQTLTEHERQLLLEYKAKEARDLSSKARGSDSDGYEKVLPRHGDAYFHKLVTIIQHNPGQVLRYSRNPKSVPLLLSKAPMDFSTLKCVHCGDRMICELQILSTLVPFLKVPGDSESTAPLEFGTAMVFTCWSSCWETSDDKSFRSERVFVQGETM